MSDLGVRFAVDKLDGVGGVVAAAVRVEEEADSASFEDVDALVAEWLVDEVVGREEAVHEFGGDGALEGVGPLGEEEQRRFYHGQVVRGYYVYLRRTLPFLSGSLNLSRRAFSLAG